MKRLWPTLPPWVAAACYSRPVASCRPAMREARQQAGAMRETSQQAGAMREARQQAGAMRETSQQSGPGLRTRGTGLPSRQGRAQARAQARALARAQHRCISKPSPPSCLRRPVQPLSGSPPGGLFHCPRLQATPLLQPAPPCRATPCIGTLPGLGGSPGAALKIVPPAGTMH